MSFVDSQGGLSAADVAAVMNGNGSNGFGWGRRWGLPPFF